MPTAMGPHRLTSIRLTAGLAASIALLSTVLAPASSAAKAQADDSAVALSLVVAQNYYGQGMPLPKSSSAWWSIHFGAQVKVTGAKPGELVEARYIQPGSGSESGFSERRVEDDGTITIGAGITYFSLAEAQAAAPMYTTPMTVEVRRSATATPVSLEVTSWQVSEPFFFRDVKMTRKGKVITFSGKLVTAAGKAATGQTVYAVQLSDWRSTNITRNYSPVRVKANGSFLVQAVGAKRGFIGLMSTTTYPSGGFGSFYSEPFTYRP